MRGLLMGFLMLSVGALFTLGVATGFEDRAIRSSMLSAEANSAAPLPPGVASVPRVDQHWMF